MPVEPEDYQDIPISTEDYASVLLHFEDGAHGVLTVNQVAAGRRKRAVKQGKSFLSLEGHNRGFPDASKQLFREVYQCILKENRDNFSFPTFADGLREVILTKTILRSAKEKMD